MKSLNFTKLEKKLKNKEKTQTLRFTFIPQYEIGELIRLKFEGKEFMVVQVTELFPIQMKDITEDIAKKDGFESVRECKHCLREMHNELSEDRWGFVIRWKPISTIEKWVSIPKKESEYKNG